MDYVRNSNDSNRIWLQLSRIFDVKKQLPENIFTKLPQNILYFPFDNIFDEELFEVALHLNKKFGEKTMYFSCIDPLPSGLFIDKSKFGQIKIDKSGGYNSFYETQCQRENDSVDDSLITQGNIMAFFDEGENWGIYVSRNDCYGIIGWEKADGLSRYKLYHDHEILFNKNDLREFILNEYDDEEYAKKHLRKLFKSFMQKKIK